MKLLRTYFFIIMLVSCKTKHNTTIHTSTFKPSKDSLAFYFPNNTFSDYPRADSFAQNRYSSALYSFKEPVLSHNFVGHSIYRFLWLRSFHRPVVFSLHQADGQIWLNTKILDTQPRFLDERVCCFSKKEKEEYTKEGYSVDNKRPELMIRVADRKANIIYNKDIFLSDKEWNEFEQLLAKANFWKLPSKIYDGDADGASWIIEGHLKNKYHVVDYHSPFNDQFEKAGSFLITLSGLQEEVY